MRLINIFKGIAFLMKYTWKFEKRYIIFSILNQILQGVLTIFAFVGGNFGGNYLNAFFSDNALH